MSLLFKAAVNQRLAYSYNVKKIKQFVLTTFQKKQGITSIDNIEDQPSFVLKRLDKLEEMIDSINDRRPAICPDETVITSLESILENTDELLETMIE